MNPTIERKICYSWSEDKGTIKITGKIFHIRPPQINLINVNRLENLGQVKAHLEDEMNKVKITLQELKREQNMHP